VSKERKDMKTTKITLGGSYTYQPEAYHSERAEYTVEVELDENDDPDVVAEDLREQISFHIALTLAHLQTNLHLPLIQGAEIEDLARGMIKDRETMGGGMLEARGVNDDDDDDDNGGW
jgi:hypothetical protein